MKRKILFSNKMILAIYFGAIAFTSLHFAAKLPVLKSGNWRATIERPDGQQQREHGDEEVPLLRGDVFIETKEKREPVRQGGKPEVGDKEQEAPLPRRERYRVRNRHYASRPIICTRAITSDS